MKWRHTYPSMSAMLEVSSSLMRTVLRVHHREESMHEASSEGEKPDTQEERERSCSMQHGAGWLSVCQTGTVTAARLLPLHSVSERSPAGLSRLQRRLRHEDEVPSRAAERKRSRSRFLYTNARHFDPQSGRPDVKSRRKPPSFSAMFGAFNALLRAVHWVHHREESMP